MFLSSSINDEIYPFNLSFLSLFSVYMNGGAHIVWVVSFFLSFFPKIGLMFFHISGKFSCTQLIKRKQKVGKESPKERKRWI